MNLKAVLIDDEEKALQSLIWELNLHYPNITILATFTNPSEALTFLEKNTPDCLFLDIEMPAMDGFQFIQKLDTKDYPIVITTAYNQYALQALKNEAIDYLLKPIDSDDLQDTILKIEKFHSSKNAQKKIEDILQHIKTGIPEKKITINVDGKLIFLASTDIIYALSDGNYSTIFLEDGRKIVLTKKLKEVTEMLPSTHFFRTHNSYLVNLSKIREYMRTEGYLILSNHQKIPVSRQKKPQLLRIL